MKRKIKNLKTGDRVVVMAYPFKGRVGTVVAIKFLVHVWCDTADALGRQLVRTRKRDLVREAEYFSNVTSITVAQEKRGA